MSSRLCRAITTHQAHERITIVLLLFAPATLALRSHLTHSRIEAHDAGYKSYATVSLYELRGVQAQRDIVGKCLFMVNKQLALGISSVGDSYRR